MQRDHGMIISRRTTGRTTARQAIVALFDPSPRFEELAQPLALDVVAALGAVNGFSLALLCVDQHAARAIGPALPAGVDLRLAAPGGEQPATISFVRESVDHGFERVIVVSADVLGLTPRLISTAASVLESESPVLGLTGERTPYLVGVNETAIRAEDDASLSSLAAISARTSGLALRGRLDRLRRLGEVESVAELREIAEAQRRALPRTYERVLTMPS